MDEAAVLVRAVEGPETVDVYVEGNLVRKTTQSHMWQTNRHHCVTCCVCRNHR